MAHVVTTIWTLWNPNTLVLYFEEGLMNNWMYGGHDHLLREEWLSFCSIGVRLLFIPCLIFKYRFCDISESKLQQFSCVLKYFSCNYRLLQLVCYYGCEYDSFFFPSKEEMKRRYEGKLKTKENRICLKMSEEQMPRNINNVKLNKRSFNTNSSYKQGYWCWKLQLFSILNPPQVIRSWKKTGTLRNSAM